MFEGPPPDPRTLRDDLPAARAAVLMRALARDPDDRFETADAMLRAWTT
jgi:hypothetical protein